MAASWAATETYVCEVDRRSVATALPLIGIRQKSLKGQAQLLLMCAAPQSPYSVSHGLRILMFHVSGLLRPS